MAKKLKTNKSATIRGLYDEGNTASEIQFLTGYGRPLIDVVLRNYKKKLKKSNIVKAVTEVKQVLDKIDQRKASDLVNSPPHYRVGGVETIDFIEAKDLNYRLGNVVKYVSRAGRKGDPLQDLEKAAWYLQREIAARKGA